MELPNYIKIRKSSLRISRNQKRLAVMEYEKFITRIEPLEVSFTENILTDITGMDYNAIYQLFLEEIASIIKIMNKSIFKIIYIDPYYFEQAYKPIDISHLQFKGY